MKRVGIMLVLALPLIVVLVLLLPKMRWKFSRPVSGGQSVGESVATNVVATVVSISSGESSSQASPLLGETILRDYANTNFPPENDLTLMSRLMENSLLLLKSAANRPLSANEDWADLLRGRNTTGERFLTETNAALNSEAQLVDRLQTPLFFHALGGGRYEIRSAGPDRKLWTADDIHRNADGSFRRGADLNSTSLMETATRGRSHATGP